MEIKRTEKIIGAIIALAVSAAITFWVTRPAARQVRQVSELKVGGIYSVAMEPDQYGVVKILALEPKVVHLRIYKNKFKARPKKLDPATLTMGSILDQDGFGIKHYLLTTALFLLWEPAFLGQTPVTKEELEGYQPSVNSERDPFPKP